MDKVRYEFWTKPHDEDSGRRKPPTCPRIGMAKLRAAKYSKYQRHAKQQVRDKAQHQNEVKCENQNPKEKRELGTKLLDETEANSRKDITLNDKQGDV